MPTLLASPPRDVLGGFGASSFVLSRYAHAREQCLDELGTEHDSLNSRVCGRDKLRYLLCSRSCFVWAAIGKLASAVRQRRRALRQEFVILSGTLSKNGFESRRLAWRGRGRRVCRHGVFFNTSSHSPCSCMASDNTSNSFANACWMPILSHDLKNLVVVPFEISRFQRLGMLQSQMRRLGW